MRASPRVSSPRHTWYRNETRRTACLYAITIEVLASVPQGDLVCGGLQGERDMLSVPPVRTTFASPSLISCAALMIDWKPLPHNLSDKQDVSPISSAPRGFLATELTVDERSRLDRLTG